MNWAQRWGRAFDRLHLMIAYANTSFDTQVVGEKFGRDALKNDPLTVRIAWVQAATDVQPASVTYAITGVLGQDGVLANYSEYFWGARQHECGRAGKPSDGVHGYLSGRS